MPRLAALFAQIRTLATVVLVSHGVLALALGFADEWALAAGLAALSSPALLVRFLARRQIRDCELNMLLHPDQFGCDAKGWYVKR